MAGANVISIANIYTYYIMIMQSIASNGYTLFRYIFYNKNLKSFSKIFYFNLLLSNRIHLKKKFIFAKLNY